MTINGALIDAAQTSCGSGMAIAAQNERMGERANDHARAKLFNPNCLSGPIG
jgi:hypothetical protein